MRDFRFSLRELGRLVSRLDGMKVVVTALVGERFLDLVETGFSESIVFNSSLQLRFLGSAPQVFRPGMPYKAYVSFIKALKRDVSDVGVLLWLCFSCEIHILYKGEAIN